MLFAAAATALGGPYVASETGLWEQGSSWLESVNQPSEPAPELNSETDSATDMFGFHKAEQEPPAREADATGYFAGTETANGEVAEDASAVSTDTLRRLSAYRGRNEIPFLNVFRFDINPEWVQNRWPRVTTSTPDAHLFGMRTPIVTGTRLRDVAGSVTWYFDDTRTVQRLRFEGTVGEVNDVVAMVTQSFEMDQEPAVGRLVFTKRWNGTPRSVVVIEQPPVIDAAEPRTRYLVRMEINRPSNRYELSPEYEAIYQAANSKPR